MSLIITALEAKQLINSDKNPIVIDLRNRDDYLKAHIHGAIHLDFKSDLSGETDFFPDLNEFAEKIGSLGVTNDATIIIYDDGNHRRAAKTWFVFEQLGHEVIKIIDGGFSTWEKAAFAVSGEVISYEAAEYVINAINDAVVPLAEIEKLNELKGTILIDSRAYERYAGMKEPKYAKAGHIPGAVNYYSKEVFRESGEWKSAAELAEHFQALNQDDEIIVSCGTGTSACLNAVALKEAGFANVKIYPGGYSEWLENGKDVATKKD